jgi:putative ABC transport system ATP-binding protein
MTLPPSPPAAEPVAQLRGVSKTYPGPDGGYRALAGVDLSLPRRALSAIVGASGSGKSTLLHLLAGLDRPSAGEIVVDGTPLHAVPQRELARWRGRRVGVVFQFFQLLPTLSAAENVMLPMDFARRWPARERRRRALGLLDRLGVAAQADKLPGALSGGQQQRVAVARALANEPALLLADEPTGNLDSANAAALLALFDGLVQEGHSIVLVTHDAVALRHAQYCVRLADGRVEQAHG